MTDLDRLVFTSLQERDDGYCMPGLRTPLLLLAFVHDGRQIWMRPRGYMLQNFRNNIILTCFLV